MLELFTRHGAFDLDLTCKGDLDVDQHHTVEDVGIALGEAVDKALGDKRGILRAGYFLMTMDETLGLAAIDLSGRAACVVDTKVRTRLVGDLQSELVYDFFEGFSRAARANVHLENHVRPLESPQDRGSLQGLRTRPARGLLARQATRRYAAQHERPAMIAVVDYKAGNLTSVMKALAAVGADAVSTDDPEIVREADKIILPGVGHFQATIFLEQHGLRHTIEERIAQGVPFLGICVGLQWLFHGSTEAPGTSWPRSLRRYLRSLSTGPESSARGLEFTHHARRIAPPARRALREFCLFHALLPRAGHSRHCGSYRIRFTLHRCRRARQYHGCAVPSGEVGPGRIANPPQLRGVAMLTRRIIACLDVTAGRVVKGVQFLNLVDAGDPAELAARPRRIRR